MQVNEQQAQDWIGLAEGGYVNNPKDPGGPTCRGITQRVYAAWLRRQGKISADVRDITKTEAEAIIADQYFAPVRFDQLPSGVDYAMGDYSTNSGPVQASKDLQRCLRSLGHRIAVDGHIGAVTLDAVSRTNAVALIDALCKRRMSFLRRLRTFSTFGKGWTRRVMGELPGTQNRDTGVIDRATKLAMGNPAPSAPKPAPGRGTGTPLPAPIAFINRALSAHHRSIGR